MTTRTKLLISVSATALTIFISSASISQTYYSFGNSIYGNDGYSSYSFGNSTYGSDGRSCYSIVNSTYCN